MILIPIILLDLLTAMFAFMEAWAFSRKGYDGLKEILPNYVEDHSVFKVERFLVWLLAIHWYILAIFSIPLPKTNFEIIASILIISASWGGKFMLIHQYVYNWTMWSMKVDGYSKGIAESKNTTSTRSNNTVRITLAIIGVVAPIAYYLI